MFFCSNHMTNLHVMVINNSCEVVKTRSISTLYNVILFSFPSKGDLATHLVIDDEIPFPRHFEPDNGSTSFRFKFRSSFFIKGSKFSAVQERTTRSLCFLAFFTKFLRGCKISIGETFVKKLRGSGSIPVPALRLKIWTVFASNSRALIPRNPKPLKAVENWFQSIVEVTDFVGVIDPQDELAAVALCKQPVE